MVTVSMGMNSGAACTECDVWVQANYGLLDMHDNTVWNVNRTCKSQYTDGCDVQCGTGDSPSQIWSLATLQAHCPSLGQRDSINERLPSHDEIEAWARRILF